MPQDALDLLNSEYLGARAKLLELAATLDRIDRAEGSAGDDPRLALLRSGIENLLESKAGRAERLQQLFSLGYDENWKENLGYPAPR